MRWLVVISNPVPLAVISTNFTAPFVDSIFSIDVSSTVTLTSRRRSLLQPSLRCFWGSLQKPIRSRWLEQRLKVLICDVRSARVVSKYSGVEWQGISYRIGTVFLARPGIGFWQTILSSFGNHSGNSSPPLQTIWAFWIAGTYPFRQLTLQVCSQLSTKFPSSLSRYTEWVILYELLRYWVSLIWKLACVTLSFPMKHVRAELSGVWGSLQIGLSSLTMTLKEHVARLFDSSLAV